MADNTSKIILSECATYLLGNVVDIEGEVHHSGGVLLEGTAGHKESGLVVDPFPGVICDLADINLQSNVFTEEGWYLTAYVQEELACGYHNDIVLMNEC